MPALLKQTSWESFLDPKSNIRNGAAFLNTIENKRQ